MPIPYTANDEEPRLISCSRRDFDQIGISPERLGIDEVNAMLFQICLAFSLVEFENEHGINNIPLIYIDQNGGLESDLLPLGESQRDLL